jgi:hypothetical protein
MVLVDGTGSNAVWALSGIDVINLEGGFRPASSRVNAYWQYTLFGTGIEFRGTSSPTESSNILVSVNGLTLNTTNFTINGTGSGPAVTVNTTTQWTFTASTGVLTLNNAATVRNNFTANFASIGTYTFKFLNQNDGGNLQVESFDVITPIHSPKSNLYADLQNTLPVGSQGISDDRQLTPIKNALPAQKAWAQAVGISTTGTTTSTVAVPCPDMSCTIKTSGGPLDIRYSLTSNNSTQGAAVTLQVFIDGIAVGSQKVMSAPVANQNFVVSDTLIASVAAGFHKVDLYWLVNGGTQTIYLTARDLVVREM